MPEKPTQFNPWYDDPYIEINGTLFKPVVGFEEDYMISEVGLLISRRTMRVQIPQKREQRFYYGLRAKDGRRTLRSVENMVSDAFPNADTDAIRETMRKVVFE